MNWPPPMPAGSVIEVAEEIEGVLYRWKQPSGGFSRFFVAAFLAVWLCGWAFGCVAAIAQILQGAGGFLWIWLVAWTIGGIFAFTVLYLHVRPPKPESVLLGRNIFRHDSGTLPALVILNPYYPRPQHYALGPFSAWRSRKITEIPKSAIGPVVLD